MEAEVDSDTNQYLLPVPKNHENLSLCPTELPDNLQDWESVAEQHFLVQRAGSEDGGLNDFSDSRESQSSHPDYDLDAGLTSSLPPPSSAAAAAAATPALTRPLGSSFWQDPGFGNRSLESSSEEGGSSEAPPARGVFCEVSEAAEAAEELESESDTHLSRPGGFRTPRTRLRHGESQSQRHLKETKAKCKRIAKLLTDAADPRNKGAALFRKRFQRAEKFALVSYGTSDWFDSDDEADKETEDVGLFRYNFVATSESEIEEFRVHRQQRNLSLWWGSVGEMDVLPDTQGKGVLMFAQRRKRIDDIVSEREKNMSKGFIVEAGTGHQCSERQHFQENKEIGTRDDPADSKHAPQKQHDYQECFQQVHQANVPKPMVPNRTAKPFLGFQDVKTSPGDASPMAKRNNAKLKVPAPVCTNPHVWSPTGDIIASRDERICVPAIKSGSLPESKRKIASKQSSQKASDSQLKNQGERKSYIEPEEDFFSLGAEACNFMQPKAIKLKNPPPVAPKPSIDPSCLPWVRRSPSVEPLVSAKSPVSQPSHGSGGLHSEDWVPPQQMANHWAPVQTSANAWTPVSSSSQPHLHSTTNSWNQQLPQSPVSTSAHSPSHRPHHPASPSRNTPGSLPNSVASCPPQTGKKTWLISPLCGVSDGGFNQSGGGSTPAGKGTQLFVKRQSGVEKFVVNAEKVHTNKPRSPSPSSSLPISWRYSSNIRAPPPLSYNPLLSPFCPASASRQAPPTKSPKTKGKPKAPPKHLNALEIMKHQPYHLDSSLFKYDGIPEPKMPSPAPSPTPIPKTTPRMSKFEITKRLKEREAASYSPRSTSEPAPQAKAKAPVKAPRPGLGRSRSVSLPMRLNSMSSPGLGPRGPQRPRVYKPPSPWEAASRSPMGSVEEAFLFQSLPSSVLSPVVAAAKLKSLPEPPDEWKRRVSLDPAAVPTHTRYYAASLSATFPPERPAFYGPPFKPARPLRSLSRASVGYM